MATAYACLARLGLDEDADARAIRRAYARELKRIDQARDPEAFQQLRASYETALDWAAWAASQAAPDQAPAPAPLPDTGPVPLPDSGPAAVPLDALQAALALDAALAREMSGDDKVPEPTPSELGSLVFEAFVGAMPALARYRGESAEPAWHDALRAALADERLLNFDARLRFEQALAHLLATGWRSGHEVLFPVAASVFGWDQGRRTLGRLGQAGRLLDLALEERAGFASQDVETRAHQREALALVRRPEPVADSMIVRAAPVLEQMAHRFPYWLPVIAPSDKIDLWRARQGEGTGRPFEVEDTAPPAAPRFAWDWRWLLAGLVVLFIVFTARVQDAPRRPPVQRAPPVRDTLPDEPPPQARLEEIASRIHYRSGPDAGSSVQRARFEVFLDEDGKVIGVNRKESVADSAFMAAAEKAILETRPFPRRTAKIFYLNYEVTPSRAPFRRGETRPDSVRPHAPAPAGHAPGGTDKGANAGADYRAAAEAASAAARAAAESAVEAAAGDTVPPAAPPEH